MVARKPTLLALSRLVNSLLMRLIASLPGSWLILLTTKGRHTGRDHTVVLPVYAWAPGTAYLVSAYGHESDWARNVLTDGRVRASVAGQERDGLARPASLREFAEALRDPSTRLPGPMFARSLTASIIVAWARAGAVFALDVSDL